MCAEGLGRLGYRSVTRPAGRGLGAMPFPSDRAALAPCCDFRTIRVRQIAEDHTIGNVVADAGLLALVLERHLAGEPDCPAGTGLRDPRTGDRCLLRSDRLSPVAEDRPHFCVATLGAAYAGAPASWPSWPGQVSAFGRRCSTGQGPCMRGKPASGPRSPPRMGARRSAAIYGDSERPGERPPPPSCPMCLSGLAYHRRDNLPGQIRAKIRPPGPSAKITQGARPLRQEPLPCNLTR
jgi:hypothetical protein